MGEEITEQNMLEKIFFTFHAFNMILQQQYCEHCFRKYSELILCLLVVEQNNELLIKNHELCPTGSVPFLKGNANTYDKVGRGGNKKMARLSPSWWSQILWMA